jgi:hypothetical protein
MNNDLYWSYNIKLSMSETYLADEIKRVYATSVNAFYFVGYSQTPELVFSHPEADVYTAVIVLTDVKPYKVSVTI